MWFINQLIMGGAPSCRPKNEGLCNGRSPIMDYPVVRKERFGARGIPIPYIFPIYGEPRSYLEFPNHLIMDGNT